MSDKRKQAPRWPELGRLIRARRQELDVTLRDAAATAKVSPTTWSGIEKGLNANPEDVTLRRIAKALRLAPERLFDLAGRQLPSSGLETDTMDVLAQLRHLLDGDPDLDDRGRKAIICVYEAMVETG